MIKAAALTLAVTLGNIVSALRSTRESSDTIGPSLDLHVLEYSVHDISSADSADSQLLRSVDVDFGEVGVIRNNGDSIETPHLDMQSKILKNMGDDEPYVVLSILSGRPSKECITLSYVSEMLRLGYVHELHVFVMTGATRKTDYSQLLRLSRILNISHNVAFIVSDTVEAGNRTYPHWVAPFYEFYGSKWTPPSRFAHNTVIIKADDDMVQIDVPRFPAFARFIAAHPEQSLVYASVVNHPMSAYFQQQHGLIPAEIDGTPMNMTYPIQASCRCWETSARWAEICSRGPGDLFCERYVARQLHEYYLKENRTWAFVSPEGPCIPLGQAKTTEAVCNSQELNPFTNANFLGWRHDRSSFISDTIFDAGFHPKCNDHYFMGDEFALNSIDGKCLFTNFTAAHLKYKQQEAQWKADDPDTIADWQRWQKISMAYNSRKPRLDDGFDLCSGYTPSGSMFDS